MTVTLALAFGKDGNDDGAQHHTFCCVCMLVCVCLSEFLFSVEIRKSFIYCMNDHVLVCIFKVPTLKQTLNLMDGWMMHLNIVVVADDIISIVGLSNDISLYFCCYICTDIR